MRIKLHGGAVRRDGRVRISRDQGIIAAQVIAVIGIPWVKRNCPLKTCEFGSFTEQ